MNNNYFTLCDSDDIVNKYLCCKKTCNQRDQRNFRRDDDKIKTIKSQLCTSICNKIFDENITYKSDCAFDNQCWNNNWDSKCLSDRSKQIEKCCIDRCREKNNNLNDMYIDCNRYCKYYDLI